jgi:hypothetical protein
MRGLVTRELRAMSALALLLAAAVHAQEPAVTNLEHYTDNRGWNEAGLGPTHQVIVTATVTPSGMPTLVYAEKDGVREALTHFPQPGAPDVYALWKRYEPAPAGSWRIFAERGAANAAPVTTPVLKAPQKIPLVDNVLVTGKGMRPRISWKLPDLRGFDIERIRVAVRGNPRVHGRFMSQLYVSPALAPTATSYTIPAGVLAAGERYVFQVMLEDLEGGVLENRSLSFSDPYATSR